jgi:hypothetical protein
MEESFGMPLICKPTAEELFFIRSAMITFWITLLHLGFLCLGFLVQALLRTKTPGIVLQFRCYFLAASATGILLFLGFAIMRWVSFEVIYDFT